MKLMINAFKHITYVFFYLLVSTVAIARTQVENVRIWTAPDNTRIVFDISDKVEYQIFTLDNPSRLVVDFEQTAWKVDVLPGLEGSTIKKIRFGARPKNNLRVVFDLQQETKPKTFVLAPNDTYGYRLVLDLEGSTQQAKRDTLNLDSNKHKLLQKELVIAIDPGHGGEDPGAIGKKNGTHEKDIVLQVSKKLAKLINETPGLQAFLVRDGDYYVGLRQRINKARSHGADLFVSVHADSFHDTAASGASVYILSEKGASSEAARWLAETENRADLIGGISLDDKGDLLAQVLFDLSQSASKAASFELADSILGSLSKVTKLHQTHVQQAGFAVLKSPDIPSVLVEIGFISNTLGESNLRKSSCQNKMAAAMLEGIKQYYSKRGQPIHPTYPTTQMVITYNVKTGDTLQKIANRHNTSLTELVTFNQLKSDLIQVGQKLKIPKQRSE